MSLRIKVISLILLSFLFYGILDYGVQRIFIMPSFISLEQEESFKNMERAVQAIKREIDHLGASATDWSVWDDTYEFVQDRNDAYRKANLNEQTLSGLSVNLLYIFDSDQQQVWGMTYDIENEQEIIIPGLVEKLGILHLTDTEASVDGVVVTTHGPVLIAVKPILTSDNQGPVKGYFVLGKFLNTVSISEQTRIALQTMILGEKVIKPQTAAIVEQLNDYNETIIRDAGEVSQVYRLLPGIDQKPALLLQVDVPRLISAKGEEAVRFALLSLLGAGLFIVVVLIFGLQKMVLSPLKQFTDHAVAIGESDDLSVHLTLNRKDEIGILSEEFDRMLERLEATRKSLMEQSYHSGRAEVAIGVLHNVGNVLNSVNVSCNLVMEQLRDSSVGDVSKVADLMVEPEGGLCHFLTEDSRGQMIPKYLTSLASALKEEQQVILKEAKSLQGKVEHIKEIVVMQQSYGEKYTASESTLPQQLMEDSFRFTADELVQYEITVKREYETVPSITVDKHKLLQVLINLMNNAKHACIDGNSKEKNIILRIFSSNNNSVNMQVADNGIGIAPENLTSIFQYGFTTRKSGHGFGLHSSALTAQELGGSLTVSSDGPDCGATFTLELPCHPVENT